MTKKGFLTGLIFKEGEPNSNDVQSSEGGKTGPQVNPVQNFTSTQAVQGVVDNKFIEVLTQIIEENNQPGQDYFEFKQAIENMKSMAMNDQQKFQTVFTVLGLQGCTKEILLSSITNYIQLIQGEKTAFDQEMDIQFKTKVKDKLTEIENSKNELEQISKRMTELNSKILTLQQDAGAEEMKIRATEANFQASADVIINEMLGDKEKINNFLK